MDPTFIVINSSNHYTSSSGCFNEFNWSDARRKNYIPDNVDCFNRINMF